MSEEKEEFKEKRKYTGENIFQKLLKVMDEVRYIQKLDGKGTVGHNYVSHDQVIDTIRGSLIKHGIYLHCTSLVEHREEVARKVRAGDKVNTITTVEVGIRFINVDNPVDKNDQVFSRFIGSGEGTDCKTPGSAYSFAIKTGLLKMLSIPCGDDEVQDSYAEENYPEQNVTQQQATTETAKAEVVEPAACTPQERDGFYENLKLLCTEAKVDYPPVLEWLIGEIGKHPEQMNIQELRRAYKIAEKQYGKPGA